MISSVRQAYNAAFTPEKFRAFHQYLDTRYDYAIKFRIAETPFFVPRDLKEQLIAAAGEIIDVLVQPGFREASAVAIPPQYNVPNESAEPLFLVLDFGICEDENGQPLPQLIELQGCPSLYAYQDLLAHSYRKFFPVPEELDHLFGGLDSDSYFKLLGDAILNNHAPENVILLEVDPLSQSTRIDFSCTEERLGVRAVCTSEVIPEGKHLFYMRDGVKTPIYRIYNRMIWDEYIQRPEKHGTFDFTYPYEVEWAGHPNWFFRISKHTLPQLDSRYVPKTYFLDQLETYPEDLSQYVLKPLFSFAGMGVHLDVTAAELDAITDRHNYILQKKAHYLPVIQTFDDPAKVEVRLMYVWQPGAARPTLITNLCRLSKGAMIGVRFNKDREWVGGSVCFFER